MIQGQDRILEGARRHADLLNRLSAVDYAPPTLAQVQRQKVQAAGELSKENERIGQLEKQTKKEFKDWRKIQNPNGAKRFFLKVAHPSHHREVIADREVKEEREYMAAFREEEALRERIAWLETEVQGLDQRIRELSPQAQLHATLRQQIQDLYTQVFSGPTPSFPDEDIAEQTFNTAQHDYDRMQSTLADVDRGMQLLHMAQQSLHSAATTISSAESLATYDLFGADNMFMDMQEHSDLESAQRSIDKGTIQLQEAGRALEGTPLGREVVTVAALLGGMQVPQGDFVRDTLFDNIWTDMMIRQNIQQAASRLRPSVAHLNAVVSRAQQYVSDLRQGEAAATQARLQQSRRDLESVREGIMRRVAAGQAGYGQPPMYALNMS